MRRGLIMPATHLLIMNQYARTISFRNMIFICLISALSCSAELQDCELSSYNCSKEDTQKYMYSCNTFYGPVDKYLFRQIALDYSSLHMYRATIPKSGTIKTFWNDLKGLIILKVSTSASHLLYLHFGLASFILANFMETIS